MVQGLKRRKDMNIQFTRIHASITETHGFFFNTYDDLSRRGSRRGLGLKVGGGLYYHPPNISQEVKKKSKNRRYFDSKLIIFVTLYPRVPI